jgi:hypothetical protein
MRLREEQVQAFGPSPRAACQPGDGPARSARADADDAPGGRSVVIVDKDKRAWVGIHLHDQDRVAVANAAYRLMLPDGTIVSGELNKRGRVRVEGIDPGTCQVSFPEFDGGAWSRVT